MRHEWGEFAMLSHYLPKALKVFEGLNNPYNPFHYLNCAIDTMFYDVSTLSLAEFNQAVWAPLPEGSIIIVQPGKANNGYGVCTPQDACLTGRDRASAVVDQYLHYVETHNLKVQTIAVAGCGSSTVGAAAFGKAVAEIMRGPVASIVTGNGVGDKWGEILGGMTIGAVSQLVHVLSPLLHTEIQKADSRTWMRDEIEDFLTAMPEALTLRQLMLRNIFKETSIRRATTLTGREIDGDDPCPLRAVVSHSKGDWVVWGALLGIEFLANELKEKEITIPPDDKKPHIDIVTFGCWVDLPDMAGESLPALQDLRKTFHYHQFVGTADMMLGLTQSPYQKSFELFVKGLMNGFEPRHDEDPDESLIPFKGHEVMAMSPMHMPIETLLRQCTTYPHPK